MLNITKAAEHSAGEQRIAQVEPLYLKTVTLVERLHRRLLDVIKDEFDRRNRSELNPIQAFLLYNIGEQEVQSESCGRGGIIWAQTFPTISRSWLS